MRNVAIIAVESTLMVTSHAVNSHQPQKRIPGRKKRSVAQCIAQGADFLEVEGAEQELVDESGIPWLAVKFDIVIKSHTEFMKDVNNDISQLAKIKGIDAAGAATSLAPKIGTALKNLVPVIDKLASIIQNQQKEDENVRDLVESLREMAGAAADCRDLKKIEGTTDVAGDIGKASLETAILVHDYVNPSLKGHAKFLERDIHAWMNAPDTSLTHTLARKKHQSGTGSWFLNGSLFSDWKEQPGSAIWLSGGPGCGKTVMCSTVIENVEAFCEQKPTARGYASFFFDGTAAQSRNLNYNGLIRSIVVELSDRCGDQIPNALVNMYNRCNTGGRQPTESQLEETLTEILETFEDTYVIIDSLDECVKKDDLLKWIRSVASKTSRNLHLMFTSRPEPEIERGLKPLSDLQKATFSETNTAADIMVYLDACLADSEMDVWDEKDKQSIQNKLSEGSDGMFRWVDLQMEAVKKCNNKSELEAQLNSLPKGLDDTYAQIFERNERPEDLQMLLQWLVFSEHPLTVAQLAEVMAVNFKTAGVPFYDPQLRCNKPGVIWGICNGLVTESEGTVKLAHFSVKEYFITRIKLKAKAHSSTSEQFSHSLIAQTCLAQLLRFDKPSEELLGSGTTALVRVNTSFPLAQYAALNWVSHFHRCGGSSADYPPLHQLTVELFASPCKTWGHALLSWVRLLNLAIEADHDLRYEDNVLGRTLLLTENAYGLPLDAPPLYYACFAGSVQAVQCLINDGANVNSVGREASTRPLLKASEEGHLEIARLLLEKEADVNVGGGLYGTALHAACTTGHLELAMLLLDKGASVDVVEGKYGTVLQTACVGVEGRLQLATLLLEKGANVDVEGGFFGTALQAACAKGHHELATLLLEKGANVNVEGGNYGTALQAACAGGHLELATLLLEKGANVNVEGGLFGTALQAACAGDHLELAMLLLDNGADVEVVGGLLGTALQAACEKGHLELVTLLLDMGANVDVVGGEYVTALHAACMEGHLELATLLLDKGASVDVEGGLFGTALQGACVGGYLELATLLLDKGANVDVEGGLFGTVLQAACAEGHLELATLLLEKGANVNVEGGEYGTALQAACAGGHLELATLLLEKGANVNADGGKCGTALRAACMEGHLELATLLLDKGANVDVEGWGFGGALEAACMGGYRNIATLLLKRGAIDPYGHVDFESDTNE
ncbi:hypothetical protein HWV62_21100 [Athelia sp. TMB]|nr:hypothetical protein HWV62_21100 [Athelia sp. TMB]